MIIARTARTNSIQLQKIIYHWPFGAQLLFPSECEKNEILYDILKKIEDKISECVPCPGGMYKQPDEEECSRCSGILMSTQGSNSTDKCVLGEH